jgi:DNA replication protein DnaC
MLTPTPPAATDRLTTLLTTFGVTTAAEEIVPRLTQAGHQDAVPVLVDVFEAEAEARRQRRIARLRRTARLPPGKTFETLDAGRLPVPIMQRLQELATGAFLETATNVLAFGLPGVGKSHALCAVAHALIEAGHSVLFTPAYAVVQELLSAKRDLDLPRALRKLDLFEVILLDDLGYVQQSPEEAEVLFTLLAERYERRSVMVTSNLVFSQWDRIFRDQMATAAAIDRLVHHAVLLEFDVPSYRTDRSRPTPPAAAPRSSRRKRAPGPLLPTRRRSSVEKRVR